MSNIFIASDYHFYHTNILTFDDKNGKKIRLFKDVEEMNEVMSLIAKMSKVINNLFSPGGLNIGVNIGKAAGAGEEHLHFHIVPRWNGDTNFIAVFDNTRVLPSSLESTYEKIKKELENV